jgi:hypothetical protein
MSPISVFDGSQPLKMTKPIRFIECFAGYGRQAPALKYLGDEFEHWKIADWARELGMDYNAFLSRMYRNGYDFEQAILPRKNKSRHINLAELKKKYTEEKKNV